MKFTGPSKPAPHSILTREQLREAWLADIERLDPVMAARYRDIGMVFPMSRHDLIRKYNEEAGYEVSSSWMQPTRKLLARPSYESELGQPGIPRGDSSTRILRQSSSNRRDKI